MAPPAALRSGRHQGRDPVLGQAFDLGAVRITIVGQGHLGPAQRGGDRLDRGHQLTPIAGALADPGAQDQLAAFGVHHGLRIVGLAVLVALALAHQPAVGVGKVALRVWPRRVVRRLGMLALGPPCAALAHCHLGLVIRPLRRGAHLGLGLEALAGGIQLGAQRRQAPDLLGQGLRVGLRAGVGRLGPTHEFRDLQLQLIHKLAGPPVRDRTVLAGVGVELAAVDADHAELEQLQLPGQEENLQEALGHRLEVASPEGRDRVVIRVLVRRHVAHTDVPVGRPLDPSARKDPVGVAVDQQRQHHPWVILGRPGAAIVGLERADADPLDRLDHEMRQVILRDPVPKIGRKQKRLVPRAIDELAHAPVLAETSRKPDRLLGYVDVLP